MNNHIAKIKQDLMDLSFNGLPDPDDAKALGSTSCPSQRRASAPSCARTTLSPISLR